MSVSTLHRIEHGAHAVTLSELRALAGIREVIAVLLPGARRDAIGMELRGLAYRAGLAV